ncbi:hypothetical protein [Hymenobacter rubripertinctus]|uniref:Uncharacterized protein n=1 Tax=Hymenobacter rubripertinctus TaxID=2029981 RepID=A0A418QII1_9BACT|nr:hypothetical protein [Hymenobacter rubripertinctus]RIY04987.1 hypothetical protein D0T11_21115 [Hymenobacter rubripertinctus]
MPSNIRTTLASTLLLGIFSAVFLLVQYKFPVSLKRPHQWGDPRPFVPDSVAQELIRQLIEQADFDGPRSVAQLGSWTPRTGADAVDVEPAGLAFRISRVLLEHQPISAYLKMKDAEVRYKYGQESANMMRQLYAEKVLSAADTAFMHQQILHSAGFRLEARYLPGCTIIPVDTLTRLTHGVAYGLSDAMSHLYSKYQTEAISWLSAPLFSLDQQYALISVTLDARGDYENDVGLLLERHQGQWRPRREIWQ